MTTDFKTESILSLLSERMNSYGDVLAQIALVKREGIWRLLFGRLIPSNNRDDLAKPKRLDYDDAILATLYFGLEDLGEAIRSMEQGGQLTLPNMPAVELKGQFSQPGILDYLHSRYPGIGVDWPADFYMFTPSDHYTAFSSGRPIFSKDAPLYPDADTAVEAEFGVALKSRVWTRNLIFLLPRYECRISGVSIGKTEIKIEVDRLKYRSPIQGKLYVSGEESDITTDFTIDGTDAIISFDRTPRRRMVYFLGDNGHLLDYRNFNYPNQIERSGGLLNYLDPVDIVNNLIQGGENEWVEFKEAVSGGRGHEFVETVVAFSNYRGGSILVGVADNCDVKGLSDPDGTVSAIESVIRDLCAPIVRTEINRLEIEGKPVIQVVVAEGQDKPYCLKDRGPCIRTGASDRSITRYELDEIYRRHENRG